MVTRRQLLASGSVVLASGLAGCSEIMLPEPEVVEIDGQPTLDEILSGKATVDVMVKNHGQTGDVDVTFTHTDASGDEQSNQTKTIEIAEDEMELVEFEIDVPGENDEFTAQAESSLSLPF